MSRRPARGSRPPTFADLVAGVRDAPTHADPAHEIRPGRFNLAGELFTPEGSRLTRSVAALSPAEASAWVDAGAWAAYEGCGCGGWAGCAPTWLDPGSTGRLHGARPRTVRHRSEPTWLDGWQGDGVRLVFAHGAVEWPGLT